MADYLTTDSELTSIADAIRAKGGTSAQLEFPSGFVTAIQNISTGITPTGTKSITITQSGTTTEDVTNYASVAISVPAYQMESHEVSNYSVTIALTNPVNSGQFGSCSIFEKMSFADAGDYIGAINSPTGSATVSVSDGFYGIGIAISGMSVDIPTSGISCTGGVTYSDMTMEGELVFAVAGDGTITIDGVDYDY